MRRFLSLLVALIVIGVGSALAQIKQVSGKVTSLEDNKSIPGASVFIKEAPTVGVTTDVNGAFIVKNVPANAKTLVFRFVGYQTLELPIGSVVNAMLKSDNLQIDEVMVVAYGTAKKSSFTGSAEVIKKEKLDRIQTSSITKALEGSTPGLQVTGGSGQPGAGSSIRVRGFGSINASSSPLFVVDGVPFDGDINGINSNDIESITVLKDASSSALYGARGANGVIMVTTKKGNKDNSSINIKATFGLVDRSVPEYIRVGAKDYYELMWEGWRNALVKNNPTMNPAQLAAIASGSTKNGIIAKLGNYNITNVANDKLIDPLTGKINPDANILYTDDWQKELFRVGKRQEYVVSMSGGSQKSDYYLSLGYLNEEGLIQHSDFNRVTGRLNTNSQIREWLSIGMNSSMSMAKSKGPIQSSTYTSNPFYFTRMIGPIYPIWKRNADGSMKIDPASGEKVFDFGVSPTPRPYGGNSNLVATLALDDISDKTDNVSMRTFAEAKLIEGLTFRVDLSGDLKSVYSTSYQNNLYGDAQNVSGRSTKEYTRGLTVNCTQRFNYAKTIGAHNISAMVGHETYQYNQDLLTATRTGYGYTTSDLVSGAVAEGSSSYSDKYTIEGFLGQLNYDNSGKYYFSASVRRDGSSRFYKDNRWGNFWSVGGSWRLSEENFLKDSQWLDNLKLKASYGDQGNDNIGSFYGWQSLYTIQDYNNNSFNGALFSSLENKELKWETIANLNVGLEFKLFKKFSGELNLFKKDSRDLLFQVPLPQSTGIGSKWQNIGNMTNKGVEFQFTANILDIDGFRWDIDGNITKFQNELTKLPQKEIVSGSKKLMVGKSVYDFWLRDFAGVDPKDGYSMYYYNELDAAGKETGTKLTTKDKNAASYYYVGSAIPDFYGGFTNTVSYKGITLAVLMTYSVGGKTYDNAYASLMHPGSFGTAWHSDILDRWTTPGQITDVPRLENGNTSVSTASSRFLKDASYFMFKNISLSYDIPAVYTKKAGLNAARVFVSGDNLKLYSAREGMDPQQSFTGVSDYTFVPNSIVTFGVNLQF